MSNNPVAEKIVAHMMANDAFSQWLGIEVLSCAPGRCHLKMTLRPEMTNGFSIAHGGISFSLADSALAFAANGYGTQCVSVETSIAHVKPTMAGDVLEAVAKEEFKTRKLARYKITIQNQEGEQVAIFNGMVYDTQKPWSIDT